MTSGSADAPTAGVQGRKYAVLGSPIAHSKSPQIHSLAYRELGLPWRYDRHELGSSDFLEFMSKNSDYSGFSVTMPLKNLAAQHASEKCAVTAATSIANTLVRSSGSGSASGKTAWQAFNTDVPGLAKALTKKSLNPEKTVILGAGATAVSAALAAMLCGASEIELKARRLDAAVTAVEAIVSAAAKLGLKAVKTVPGDIEYDPVFSPSLVLSTLPGSASPALSSGLCGTDLYEVAYSEQLSSVARQLSPGRYANGLSMLAEQAVLQLRIFVHGDIDEPLPQESCLCERIYEFLGA